VNAEWFALIAGERLSLDTILKSDVHVKRSPSSLVIEGKLSSVQEALNVIQSTVVNKYEEIAKAELASVLIHRQINGAQGKPCDNVSGDEGKDMAVGRINHDNGKFVDQSDRDKDRPGDRSGYNNDHDHSDSDDGKSGSSNANKDNGLRTSDGRTLVSNKNGNLKFSSTLDDRNESVMKQNNGAHLDQDVSTRSRNDGGLAVGIQIQEIEEHIWNYLKFRSLDRFARWEALLSPCPIHTRGLIQLNGKADDLASFKEFCQRNDLFTLTKMVIDVPVGLDGKVEEIARQTNVLASRSQSGAFELTGQNDRVLELKTQLDMYSNTLTQRQTDPDASFHSHNSSSSSLRANTVTAASVSSSAVTAASGVNNGLLDADKLSSLSDKSSQQVNGASGIDRLRGAVVGVSSGSTGSIRFETPLARLRVEVFTGDLTLQNVDVIVNAANGHLLHGGGAAKAIARAAGSEIGRAHV